MILISAIYTIEKPPHAKVRYSKLLNINMNRHRIVAKLIEWSVPILNLFRNPEEWPYPFEQLNEFEDHTLGKALYNFLNSRNLGYLPKYEEHDTYHVLLGYGTSVTEELKLQAFMWGNKNSTFAGRVLFIIGYIVFPSKHSLLKREMIRGSNAKPLSGILVASMIPMNLLELRSNLCID
ncbi:hypothetical protein ACPUEK_13505 [Marinomonas gallaica]|uniref:hypothetical protein n=1 Tax=Marinomonas gallaica TaxID=1806667 RepID=UPI003CE45BDE